jgi:hypothetical protein
MINDNNGEDNGCKAAMQLGSLVVDVDTSSSEECQVPRMRSFLHMRVDLNEVHQNAKDCFIFQYNRDGTLFRPTRLLSPSTLPISLNVVQIPLLLSTLLYLVAFVSFHNSK